MDNKKEPVTTFFNAFDIRRAQKIFRALNHKLRTQIMDVIYQAGTITVSDIYTKLLLEQSVVSQHLKILRDAGAVKTSRDGKFIYYSVDTERLQQIANVAKELLTLKVSE